MLSYELSSRNCYCKNQRACVLTPNCEESGGEGLVVCGAYAMLLSDAEKGDSAEDYNVCLLHEHLGGSGGDCLTAYISRGSADRRDVCGGEKPPMLCRCPDPKPCAVRVTKKDGPNKGRQFLCCPGSVHGQCKMFSFIEHARFRETPDLHHLRSCLCPLLSSVDVPTMAIGDFCPTAGVSGLRLEEDPFGSENTGKRSLPDSEGRPTAKKRRTAVRSACDSSAAAAAVSGAGQLDQPAAIDHVTGGNQPAGSTAGEEAPAVGVQDPSDPAPGEGGLADATPCGDGSADPARRAGRISM